MIITPRAIWLVLAVVAFTIGAVRPGLWHVDWQSAGLGLVSVWLLVG